MFYITFTKKKQEIRYVALPAQYQGKSHYYQIYENGRPLSGICGIKNLKSARKALEKLPSELERLSNGWVSNLKLVTADKL